MTAIRKGPYRADHVGSLLRPPRLHEARDKKAKGEITPAQLRAVEDECIRDVVAFQEEVGLLGITDGEYRRAFWHLDFLEQIDGVEITQGNFTSHFRRDDGVDVQFSPPVMKVVGKLGHAHPIQGPDFAFLKPLVSKTAKVSIPSPSMLHFRGGREAIDKAAYPDMAGFYADLAKVYAEEVSQLAAAGCRYLQLDDTNLAYLCDETIREGVRKMGEDPNDLPRTYARLLNESIASKPADMAVCVHMCRGNFKSAWVAQGGYEPVAEILFNEMNIDGFFMEYDDKRSGDFAPLRFLPKGKTVVLGLVSSKFSRLESKDDLRRRIDEATKFAPIEQLAISAQCGFSSTVEGNDITWDDQRRKLALCIEIAEEVWGGLTA